MHPMAFILLSKLLNPFISFVCMTVLLFFFLTPRILSFDSHACHVSYSSILIVHSFNFISVHDNFLVLLCTY